MMFTLREVSGLGFAPSLSPDVREGEEDNPLCPQAHLKKVTLQSRVITREPVVMDPGGGVSRLFPDSSWRTHDTLFWPKQQQRLLLRKTDPALPGRGFIVRQGRARRRLSSSVPATSMASQFAESRAGWPAAGVRETLGRNPESSRCKLGLERDGREGFLVYCNPWEVIVGTSFKVKLPFSLLPNARGIPQSTKVTKLLWRSK